MWAGCARAAKYRALPDLDIRRARVESWYGFPPLHLRPLHFDLESAGHTGTRLEPGRYWRPGGPGLRVDTRKAA